MRLSCVESVRGCVVCAMEVCGATYQSEHNWTSIDSNYKHVNCQTIMANLKAYFENKQGIYNYDLVTLA